MVNSAVASPTLVLRLTPEIDETNASGTNTKATNATKTTAAPPNAARSQLME
jgi:hypothetical protein